MSKMVVLPKTPLYIGWLVCVLVIPVGHENEKGLAPVLLQVQAFCYMQIQPPSWHSVLRAGGKAAFRQRSGVTYHDLRHRCWHGTGLFAGDLQALCAGRRRAPGHRHGCRAGHPQADRSYPKIPHHPLPPTAAGWWGEQTPPALYKNKAGGVCWLGLFRGDRAWERLPLFRG